MADTVGLIIKSATTFYNQLKADQNGRYRSWEHCYKNFHDARNNTDPDYDYMSLQLAFYLASWGMYRGSSFLLQKDYKVHIPVVEEILKEKYDCLFGLECAELRKTEVQKRLLEVGSFMMDYYDDIRKRVRETEVKYKLSTTLITKILMGAFGCVPAYDRYFIDGVKDQKITTGTYNIKSLMGLVDFYENNRTRLEKTRKGLKVYDLSYPQMKLLDMGFWQIGFEKDSNKGLRNEQISHGISDKHKQYVIRGLRKNEVNLLKDFLYEAIFIPEGVEPPERDIVEKPELRVYTDDFGSREGDNCLVADFGGNVVGAVWTRIMNDYGHVDDDTPSFAISLYKDYRGQGIGSQLMVRMLELLKWQGYKRASLAVQKANYAVKMYEKVGFRTVDENAEEYIMVYEL